MATPKVSISPESANLRVNVFNGSREPFTRAARLLIRVIDGRQRQISADFHRGPSVAFAGLPFHDNFADNYTVIVSADDHLQAGFTPVKVARGAWRNLDLMLLPKDATFNFGRASWSRLKTERPAMHRLLASEASSDASARERYRDLIEERAPVLACFFNIATALEAIDLPVGSPLDYLRELVWEEMFEDRFFAYADASLIEQVEAAVEAGVFQPEVGSGFFHPGATRSYKQVQFGEANVQLTFHEGDVKTIDGVECVRVEPDIDYFRDRAAHALLEVVHNRITGAVTDPRQVYALRWIAGRRAGVPAFEPPYVIV